MPRDDGVNKLALGLHTVAFVVNAWGLYLSATTPNMPGQHTWAGQFKFMTIWNVVFQVVFFGTSLLFDLTKHKSRKFMDQFFNAVVFPFAWTVVLLFWGLYAVDRDLIFPMSLDSIYPPYLNIQQHTLVGVFVFLEAMIVHHKRDYSGRDRLIVLATAAAYIAWACFIRYKTGEWVYVVLAVLPVVGKVALFGAATLLLLFCHLIGKYVNAFRWDNIKFA
eukprot:TRINITY_DN2332_c0_g1_i1.p1 TRINITY_DN2332_c0_g1~~TRINITY_DN2332_c0_g1_i1.p1  ORF type:complete len:220 (-),score=32.53 TRINITY_DN2332_c0_g1_i1:41-700(-)